MVTSETLKKEHKKNGFYNRLDNYFRALEANDFNHKIEEYHKKRGR